MSLWTPLCCFVATMHLFSQSLSTVPRCGGLQRNVNFSSLSARCIRWLGFALIRLLLCRQRHIDALCMLCKVNSNFNHCLFSELPSANVRVQYTQAAAAAHPLGFVVSRCRTSDLQDASCRPRLKCGMTFPTLCLMGLREQSIVSCFREFVFQFSEARVLVGQRKQFINIFFPTWTCAVDFNIIIILLALVLTLLKLLKYFTNVIYSIIMTICLY